jgi:hypothetical protein
MNKVVKAVQWVARNLHFISIVIFIAVYLRWFRITPFVYLNDPSFAFVGGMVLLFIYIVLALISSLSRIGVTPRILFYSLAVIFLVFNVFYLQVHMPGVEATAKCNGITYYISHGSPLFDEQWTYVQLTKWRGMFNYESYFYGYAPSASANEIICDVEKNETHFIRDSYRLIYIDGENPIGFEGYWGAQLKGYLYFMSEEWLSQEHCNEEESKGCDIVVYTLYQCKLNFTDCNPLPISYTASDVFSLELRADEITNEISLFRHYFSGDDETLIFTYGENTRCYEDGCKN